ncbi:S8 family serine peptidase [Shewanella corallii]|uniref:S8 family serine peptidase n=1 Tax=Shewanella corallii TaxID=560080 RepID=UPI0024B37D0E|nr:S8 family serine peptidase [Shewanella corallii]
MKTRQNITVALAIMSSAGVGAAANTFQDKHQLRQAELVETNSKTSQSMFHPMQDLPNKPGHFGVNVHRAPQGNHSRATPFVWEDNLEGPQTYIIQMEDAPTALYQGGVNGFAATSARAIAPTMGSGERFGKVDFNQPAVISYQNYLTERQDTVVTNIQTLAPQAEIQRRYNVALNGVTMELTQEQAAKVARMPGVTAVTRSRNHQLFTFEGPKHIGADDLWQGNGVPANVSARGEGVLVGIIDTGINSDHPSFAAVSGDGYRHKNPLGEGKYLGDCVESPDLCNSKLIGIRSYETITDSYKNPEFQPDVPESQVDYKRPPNGEDYNGHGSHVAGTAAGNLLSNVPYKIPNAKETGDGFDTNLHFNEISGVAPRANIISYQACFPGDGSYDQTYVGCPTDVLIATIEDAIEDGVDVINFSIGSIEKQPWYDAIELAFLSARESGISVAAAAGNFGHRTSLIDHVSPWLTSVGATTHGKQIKLTKKGALTLSTDIGLGEIEGQGISGSFTGTLVNAAAYGDEQCLEPFSPGTFEANQIVICKRGEIARVTKGTNVAAGGAGAIILYNATADDDGQGSNQLFLNPFPIPGLHIDFDSGSLLGTNVLINPDLQATISPSILETQDRNPDLLGSFSSRGPSRTTPDVMVPNLAAPGVDIFAPWADDMPFTKQPNTADFASISGTSMASPHIAGAMALLTQAHPEWTPAMIQSALMMTAKPGKREVNDETRIANFHEMGSGVINVGRAVRAGLVLDEKSDNYKAANPDQGGDITALNLPYLVNANCQLECTWLRTFTATSEGSWNVSTKTITVEGAPFLELEVYPKSFTLRKGQHQLLKVKAKLLDVDTVGSPRYETMGEVHIEPTSNSLPAQYLPVIAKVGSNPLPPIITGKIHRNDGTLLTPELKTKEIKKLNTRVSGLAIGKQQTHKLTSLSGTDFDFKKPETFVDNPGINIQFFDVPEGTRRIVWEETSQSNTAKSSIDIGIDLNKDGLVNWHDEAICYSFTDAMDYCAINDPEPGRYWALVGNFKRVIEGDENTSDTISTSLAIISNSDNDNLSVSGPQSSNGLDPYQLELKWALSDAKKGDRYYAFLEIGNSPDNLNNIGKMGVNLVHGGDDITVTPSKEQAAEGDIVEFTVTMQPNLLSLERKVDLQVQWPKELQLVKDKTAAISAGRDLKDKLSIQDASLSLSVVQDASNTVKRDYLFTTSDDDPSCRVPIGNNPYYLDLLQAGINAIPQITGAITNTKTYKLSTLGISHIPLYNNEPQLMEKDTLTISPGGFIQLDSFPFVLPIHFPLEKNYAPDTIIAPLWRGDGAIKYGYDRELEEDVGVSVAATQNGRYLVVEWDNMHQETVPFINENPDPNARYSFEVIASSKVEFTPGQHEFIFAYDKLTGKKMNIGAIGTHGYYGPMGSFGPAYGRLGKSFAYDNLDKKIKEGLVVCANYQGPEQSEIKVKFAARVSATAVGKDMEIKATSDYTGSKAIVSSAKVKIPSNLTIGQLEDMTVKENEEISFEVTVRDRANTANAIKAEGKNVSAKIDGNKVTLKPDAHWYGKTKVTVTAYDKTYPNDAASTSFTLEVTSDGKPKPEAPKKPETDKKPKSGGSLGWLSLIGLGVMASLRRRKLH